MNEIYLLVREDKPCISWPSEAAAFDADVLHLCCRVTSFKA